MNPTQVQPTSASGPAPRRSAELRFCELPGLPGLRAPERPLIGSDWLAFVESPAGRPWAREAVCWHQHDGGWAFAQAPVEAQPLGRLPYAAAVALCGTFPEATIPPPEPLETALGAQDESFWEPLAVYAERLGVPVLLFWANGARTDERFGAVAPVVQVRLERQRPAAFELSARPVRSCFPHLLCLPLQGVGLVPVSAATADAPLERMPAVQAASETAAVSVGETAERSATVIPAPAEAEVLSEPEPASEPPPAPASVPTLSSDEPLPGALLASATAAGSRPSNTADSVEPTDKSDFDQEDDDLILD